MVFHGVAGGGYSRGDPDLAINRGQVRVDGARTDDEALGHLLIGQSYPSRDLFSFSPFSMMRRLSEEMEWRMVLLEPFSASSLLPVRPALAPAS